MNNIVIFSAITLLVCGCASSKKTEPSFYMSATFDHYKQIKDLSKSQKIAIEIIESAKSSMMQGQYAVAIAKCMTIEGISFDHLSKDDYLRAKCYKYSGSSLAKLGSYDKAIAEYAAYTQIAENQKLTTEFEYTQVLSDVADILYHQKKLEQSLQLSAVSYSLQVKFNQSHLTLPESHYSAQAYNAMRIASIYGAQHQFGSAESFLKKVILDFQQEHQENTTEYNDLLNAYKSVAEANIKQKATMVQ